MSSQPIHHHFLTEPSTALASVKLSTAVSSIKPSTIVSSVKPSTTLLSVKPSNTVSSVKTIRYSFISEATRYSSSARPSKITSCLSLLFLLNVHYLWNVLDLSLQLVPTQRSDLLPVNTLIRWFNIVRHLIDCDSSCLYHTIAHQVVFIPPSSRGDRVTSNVLRQLVCKMIYECPHVCMQDWLS